MSGERVLVVDDDSLIRDVLSERLARRGYRVSKAASLTDAREAIGRTLPDIALLDVKLPDGEGTELLEQLEAESSIPCVMMTAHGTVASAVEALKMGAEDYLEKPFTPDRLEATLRHVLERTRLRREVRALRERGGSFGAIVGPSAAMTEVLDLVRRIAPAEHSTVLLLGETGTGKGMIARALHDLSGRSKGPFVNVTCSALAETLMESELFGHEKGAFTDARTRKRGLVEVAAGGTLFLDEIGELSLGLQGKLLRFLEDRTFRRVGGTVDLEVDTRIVAATNRDLASEVDEGRFREDLYYRLRVLPVTLPPLRHRRDDVRPLVLAFIDLFNAEFGKCVREVDPSTMVLLEHYAWPGNVRELRNVVERAVLLTDAETLRSDVLPPEVRTTSPPRGAPASGVDLGSDGVDLNAIERELLDEALRRSGGNRTEAGRLLGLSRHQVRNRLRKYGMVDS